jgi:type VI secretion system protein ImpJ
MSTLAIPDEVMWEEGMLLAPQHFQQASLRTEELLHYHVRAAAPWLWGVRELEFDPRELPGGLFRVTLLEAVMPDGTPVRVDRDAEAALAVDLAPHAEEARGRALPVWLCVPKRRGSQPRSEAVDDPEVADANQGGAGPVMLRRLRPRLALKVGPLPPDAYASFPLARVILENEKFAPTAYEPPRLAALPGCFPHGECRELARRVRNKANTLAARGDDSPRTDEQVRFLVAGLLPLEAILSAELCHPFQLYLALCALAGHLAGVAPRKVPLPFPPYAHDELRDTFAPVLEFARDMLDRVSEVHVQMEFRLTERGDFEVVLRREWLRALEAAEAPGAVPKLLVGVVSPGGADAGDAEEWLRECRIGSAGRLPSIRDRRLLGADRSRVRDLARVGFAPGRGEALFHVAADPEFVAADEPLVIENPRDPSGRRRPRQVLLYTRTEP